MARNKLNRETLRDANEKMREWNYALEMGEVTSLPESVIEFRDALEKFYENAGKNVKNPELFSTHAKLTEEQEEELVDIATGFINEERADLATYEDFMEDPTRTAQRDRLNVKNLDDAIEKLDQLNDYKDDALFSKILSSNQIIELYNEGKERGLSEAEVEKKIYDFYKDSGAEGKTLYENIWKEITRDDGRSFNK